MFQSVTVKVPPGMTRLEAEQKVRRAAESGVSAGLDIIKAKVIDLTPRYTGKMQSYIFTRQPEPLSGFVYTEGVVPMVHEKNAVWSKFPPIAPLQGWVQKKLGISDEKKSKSVAFLIARKIRTRGLTLPNKEGKGQMFARARAAMAASGAYFVAFAAKMKAELALAFGGSV